MLLTLLCNGLNERFSGTNAGAAFGDGAYLAEDIGKVDQYVKRDKAYNAHPALHARLYGRTHRHPENVYYALVCRVALGHSIRTTQPGEKATSTDTRQRV